MAGKRTFHWTGPIVDAAAMFLIGLYVWHIIMKRQMFSIYGADGVSADWFFSFYIISLCFIPICLTVSCFFGLYRFSGQPAFRHCAGAAEICKADLCSFIIIIGIIAALHSIPSVLFFPRSFITLFFLFDMISKPLTRKLGTAIRRLFS